MGAPRLDPRTRTTYLYISAKSTDLAGTVLHTFLSSRRCSRTQCFLAEYVLADQARRLSEEWELPERLQIDIDVLDPNKLKQLLERLEMEGSLDAPVLFAKLRGYCEDVLERKGALVWWVDEENWV
ncbi:hypothetical protein K458DRAFT_392411 [Lentithecium fluviatile CBS 122367]|uniref:Uncharacterized protein n=1 Tax=Lentithecium fluviatile CBS 122367 TaxID=1168545 RepID=A0A6G1IR58_9PLEO|nr:hypothetical protein K458DRAFT_392411 [Lentithecium fluviatile CBS 122367]